MNVEVLYFDGRPHRDAAVRRLQDIFAEEVHTARQGPVR